MNRLGAGVCTLGCWLVFAASGAAQEASQSNPWNGTWKADLSSMKYDGATFSLITTPAGYTLMREGTPTKVVCDGKPMAPVNGVETACTKTETGYALENTRDGKPTSHVKVTISPDGTTMTRVANVIPTEGEPYDVTLVSKKVSGGKGEPTVWKESSFTESQDTGVLSIQVNGDSIDFKETDNDKPITCSLDGTPTKMGTRSMAVKLADPHTLKVTYSNNGKVQRENSFVLSDDGKSIVETDVTSAPSTSTMTMTLKKS